MIKHESKIAYFRIELSQEKKITTELIREKVDKCPWPLEEKEKDEIARYLEHVFDITQEIGCSVTGDEYKPWLSERRNDISFYYWNRLKRYYLERGVLPPNVVSTLDTVTDEILDYSGNPDAEGAWKQRGMVVGHVQSGKTTNYSSLICKAADAGYKIIILLAGITNSLRHQTQERLDESFIGKKSVFQAIAPEPLPIIHFSDTKRFPVYGTSRDKDFSKNAASTYGISLSALKEPIIFVTKKNKSTLENLRDWLAEQNFIGKINDPLLLIDDEADNASINTSKVPTRATAINSAIREILALFNRSTYIGYTATPFANIFIDPESEHKMLEDDLFPRNFIKALDPPSNYVGAMRVFQENGDLVSSMVRVVEDYVDILPLKHKKDHKFENLPPSLLHAIRTFVLTRAILVVRGQGNKSCSMMINVSRFNDIQDIVNGLTYKYLDSLKSSIVVNSGLGDKATEDDNIMEVQTSFNEEFSGCGHSFEEILSALPGAIGSISTRTINMRGGILDYSKNKETGLHVIAIGGLALSRGLTLEGLTVSYILRNASASDTLMQMARWFGYRPNYEDVCRLFLPEQSLEHYEFITDAIEELRAEINRMEQLGMTPNDFGLRVRHDPTAIRITAANKMRSASKIAVAQDYSGRHVEGYALYDDNKINQKNLILVQDLISGLGEADGTSGGRTLQWKKIDASIIYQLVKEFSFPAAHTDLGPITGSRSLFVDYMSDRLNADLNEWDVALPMQEKRGEEAPNLFPGHQFYMRNHHSGTVDKGIYKVTSKNKVANPGDEKKGLASELIGSAESDIRNKNYKRGRCAYSFKRERPLLLVHVFSGGLKDGTLNIDGPIASLSFCMPATTIIPKERWYQVNRVYRDQLLALNAEPEDDEPILDEVDHD